MANKTAPCRVCGKLFVPCNKSSAEIGAFNYREVACSPECGQVYLKRVLDVRKPATKKVSRKKPKFTPVVPATILQANEVDASEDIE